jgi:hypothetical protein
MGVRAFTQQRHESGEERLVEQAGRLDAEDEARTGSARRLLGVH